jgi:hypothetical protein
MDQENPANLAAHSDFEEELTRAGPEAPRYHHRQASGRKQQRLWSSRLVTHDGYNFFQNDLHGQSG